MKRAKQVKPTPTPRSLTLQSAPHLRLTAAEKRHRRASQQWFRRWLQRVDSWKKLPGYQGVTFPGIKDGDRLAEELVEFARRFVEERIE